MSNKRKSLFITITQIDNYIGVEQLKIGQVLSLYKDIDNCYDDESIVVKTKSGVKCGYVANSVCSVARGTHSAGYIYNTFNKETSCIVMFVIDDKAIAKISDEEYIDAN